MAMRDAIGIHVERAIAHVFERESKSDIAETVISELELPLKTEPKLHTYFDGLVANALSDPMSGAAVFKSDGNRDSEGLCYGILNKNEKLVPNSQALAKCLFDIMSQNRNIRPGSFVVCTYTASNYKGRTFLALIKLYPSEVLVQKVDKKKKVVSYEVRDDAMPRASEKLQKAAMIQPKPNRKSGKLDYALLLLDRQTGSKVAADFFAKTFLNAGPALDERERTSRFYNAVTTTYSNLLFPKDKKSPLTPKQAETLIQQRDAVISSLGERNVREWADGLDFADASDPVAADEIREQIYQAVHDVLPDDKLVVDTQKAREILSKKHRIRGDNGVLIEWVAASDEEVFPKNVFPNGPPMKLDSGGTEQTEIKFEIVVKKPRLVG
jgi:hypothetical protein